MMVTGYWLGEWESIQDRDISRLICFLTNGTRGVKLSWREAHHNRILLAVSQPFFPMQGPLEYLLIFLGTHTY